MSQCTCKQKASHLSGHGGNEEQLRREVVSKLGLARVLPPIPQRELTPRSGHGVNSTHRRAQASQHSSTGHKPERFLSWQEDNFNLINRVLRVKDDHRTPSPELWQCGIRAQESSRAGERRSSGPTLQCYIGAQFRDLGTQPIFGWLHGKDTMQEKGIYDLWGTSTSNQQAWCTEEIADHLPPWCWAREAQGHKTIDVPIQVPLGPRNNMGRDGN